RRELFLAALGAFATPGIDLDRVVSVLAGTRADAPVLDDFETITVDLVHREAAVSPQALLPAVRGHLAGLRDVLVWTPPALASRAYSLAGQTALLAGYLWDKQDNGTEAETYWWFAERCGDMAGDVRLRVALLELRSVRLSPRWDRANLPVAL